MKSPGPITAERVTELALCVVCVAVATALAAWQRSVMLMIFAAVVTVLIPFSPREITQIRRRGNDAAAGQCDGKAHRRPRLFHRLNHAKMPGFVEPKCSAIVPTLLSVRRPRDEILSAKKPHCEQAQASATQLLRPNRCATQIPPEKPLLAGLSAVAWLRQFPARHTISVLIIERSASVHVIARTRESPTLAIEYCHALHGGSCAVGGALAPRRGVYLQSPQHAFSKSAIGSRCLLHCGSCVNSGRAVGLVDRLACWTLTDSSSNRLQTDSNLSAGAKIRSMSVH